MIIDRRIEQSKSVQHFPGIKVLKSHATATFGSEVELIILTQYFLFSRFQM